MNPPALDDKAKTLPEEKALSILQLISQCLADLQMGIPVEERLRELESIPKQEFLACFLEDGMRKAFWINAYNIFNLVAMQMGAMATFFQTAIFCGRFCNEPE